MESLLCYNCSYLCQPDEDLPFSQGVFSKKAKCDALGLAELFLGNKALKE